MSFQCHGPALRTNITFAGASIDVGVTYCSSHTVGAGRFDTYAESVSARTSLAPPEGQTATPPARCKLSLPHHGKFAGSRDLTLLTATAFSKAFARQALSAHVGCWHVISK